MLEALRRPFVDDLIDNDEKVASKKPEFKKRVKKSYPI